MNDDVPYPFESELCNLQNRIVTKCHEIVNLYLNVNSDPKLIKLVKAGRWMEETLAKRQSAPVLESLGYGDFELTDWSEDEESSIGN